MLVQKSALVPFSAKMMYDLVCDIEAYREFLPWCRDSRVDETHDDGVTASVEIARSGVSKWFTTRNTVIDGKRVQLDLVEGPFRQLHGVWVFHRLDDNACKIELEMEFEFSNRLVELAFGAIFSQVVNLLIDSFCKRAKVVYARS
ncbi:MAG TPA: type II toxin-antitoxin system RatA family toxin [Chromatiaceae bacterium]|jgi:ribosome-associated toxin RatA of RatAB toxin-antitoxin module|nr:type II toxin-antitoxin system RatA family toxin [Chromatiaceae bacterium]HIB84999.1 type II toxin-antitoxin system RatA family toxin [Chromatiaceae bacterium]HIN81532.1 type II toxin-antitoxin system RatA family toxin [Chromatiales bacterium]HIO14421.1 type II toxin-antitoxin system RatA family toxin [Chromatiales bacterium]HIO54322.1 type II toxin-antitoxin system RatA family toxin [Chromatiales bacterium]